MAEDNNTYAGITAFAIVPLHNTGGQNDATGAFLPGAQKFARAYNCPWRSFDNIGPQQAVRKRFFDEIENHCPSGTNLFAYFGHGIAGGLASADVYTSQLDDFVKVLTPKIAKPFVAVLYACSSGTAGAFSSKLRAKLGGDVWVYGHTTVGHAFLNPDVSEESSSSTPTWRLLYDTSAELRGPWAEALKYSDLWLRFPLMTYEQMDAELCARRLMGRWEVTGSGVTRHYKFDWVPTSWRLNAGDGFALTPGGAVTVVDPKRPSSVLTRGSWEIIDALSIRWDSGGTESWPLPIRTVGQQGMAGGTQIRARRIARPEKLGTLQG